MAGGEASLLLRIKTAGEEALKKAEESFDSLKTAAIGAFAIISAVVVKSIADYRQSEVATNALTQSMVNNGIYSKQLKNDYDKVLRGAMITGFIEQQHTKIAQDGLKGYGGKCFGPNIESIKNMLFDSGLSMEADFFEKIHNINDVYRNPKDATLYQIQKAIEPHTIGIS